MRDFIEINPDASSTSARTIPVRKAAGTAGKVSFFQRKARQSKDLDEDVWEAYKQMKSQFYEVCRRLSES